MAIFLQAIQDETALNAIRDLWHNFKQGVMAGYEPYLRSIDRGISMDLSHKNGLRFLILLGFILAACQVAPAPAPTTAPTSTPTLTVTPTLTPAPSATPRPSSTPTRTVSPTPAATYTITYIAQTKMSPCEIDSNCLVSPDGQWAAEEFCEWVCMNNSSWPSTLPYIRIYKQDGSTAWTIYCDQSFSFSSYEDEVQLTYSPWMFDPTGQWLYAWMGMDAVIDGSFLPSTYGLVKIDLRTGQVIPLLGTGKYYSVALSADETRLVYTRQYLLGILDLNTGAQQLISLPYRYPYGLEWSPDGSQLMLEGIKDFSDFPLSTWDIAVISPDSATPLDVVYQIPPGTVVEWNPVYGIVVKDYERVYENGKFVDAFYWWGIDPANPTPVAIPSPTATPTYNLQP